MGYELYITRAPEWVDSEELPIGRGEWHDFADQLPELREDATIEWRGREPEPTFEYTCSDDSPVSLYWYRGKVVVTGVKNQAMAEEVVWLAELLSARLVGDDGEEYSHRPAEQ